MLILCGVGAFVLHNALQTFSIDVVHFLPNYFPQWNTPLARILEALFFSCIGAVVAYYVVSPQSGGAAIVSGFGWTGLLKGVGEITKKVKSGKT